MFFNKAYKNCDGVYWSGTSHAGLVDDDVLKAMYSAGCSHLVYGLESFDKKILRKLGKGSSQKANINSVPTDWYFLIKKHAGMGIYKNPSGDYPYLEMWVASGKSAQSHADIRYNTWQHCVGVYDGTNNILTYIDGKLRAGAAAAGPSTTTDDSSIVRIGRESATDKNLLHGKITSVKIYDRALSVKEILQNYNTQRSRFGV